MKIRKSKLDALLMLKPSGSKTKPVSRRNKLKPASVLAQKTWKSFSPVLKNELRKDLPDRDRDGVPNGFDCRPKNPKRQDSFLAQDAAYLNSNSNIRFGKKLGSGNWGAVYSVKGNRNLIVKVPIGFTNDPNEPNDTMYCASSRSVVEDEANMYTDYNLEGEPLFIPTKVVKFNSMGSGDFIGLVRPRVKTVIDYSYDNKEPDIKRITNSQLKEIRGKLIELSYKGFVVEDGLQIGFDRTGRALLYDFGGLVKYCINNSVDRRFVFDRNQKVWLDFLVDIGKINSRATQSERERVGQKYGRIEP